MIPEQLLRDFEPQEVWLSHDSVIHGMDHMTRVFILQELICERLEEQGTRVNHTALRYAAMAHDVGRIDDGPDYEHGRRSATWIKDNLADEMSPEDMDVATYIVHWHVPADSEAPVMTIELQVLKDADGLDRVRLGDLDPSYLRTDAAKELIETAQKLYDLSQSGERKATFRDVVEAARALNLVHS